MTKWPECHTKDGGLLTSGLFQMPLYVRFKKKKNLIKQKLM